MWLVFAAAVVVAFSAGLWFISLRVVDPVGKAEELEVRHSAPVPVPTPYIIPCGKLVWIHPPKTSSTMCMTIQHTCCAVEFERMADRALAEVQRGPTNRLRDSKLVDTGWGCTSLLLNSTSCKAPGGHGHSPLLPTQNESMVVLMLREPRSRVVSAYLDGLHAEGLPEAENRAAVWRNSSLSTAERVRAYANHPAMKGCQTKMMLGLQCCSSETVTQDMQAAAEQRLSRALFVGIFERYAESVALLHATMKRNTTTHALELTPGRSFLDELPADASKRTKGEIEIHLTRTREREEALEALADYFDPADEALYAEAVRLFQSKVASL